MGAAARLKASQRRRRAALHDGRGGAQHVALQLRERVGAQRHVRQPHVGRAVPRALRQLALQLPGAGQKVTMLARSLQALQAAGYVYVGMDHFALPQDALAVAKRQGRLHRNFQGYSTQPDCDLIALGVSSIGSVGPTYSQNAKTLDEYYDLIDHGRLPVVRGLALSRDDILRRAVIKALMCQGAVHFEAISHAYLIDFPRYFAAEMVALGTLQAQGMVDIDQAGIQVTAMGWYFVRAVAMVFDRNLQSDINRTRFSKIL